MYLYQLIHAEAQAEGSLLLSLPLSVSLCLIAFLNWTIESLSLIATLAFEIQPFLSTKQPRIPIPLIQWRHTLQRANGRVEVVWHSPGQLHPY